MASRPSSAPDRVGAGYRKFQRHLTHTTQRTDLTVVVPGFARRVRRQLGDLARTTKLPAVLGIGATLVVAAAVFIGLSGASDTKARMPGPVPVGDAGSVSLQVSGGFGVNGSVVQDPDAFTDPNAGTSAQPDTPLSRLLDGLTGGDSGASRSGGASTGAPVTAAVPNRDVAGAQVESLANTELIRLFGATNAERSRRGLEPLLLDTSLNRSAQLHADWMASHGVLCHSNECDRADEPDPSLWNGWGENIAYSTEPNAYRFHTAFMASPPHRENMLDPRHHYVGLGWTTGRLAHKGTVVVFVVVQFGMQRR